MEHKFIIEVTLKHVGPTAEDGVTKPQGPTMNFNPAIIQSIVSQLPAALAAMQNQQCLTGHPPKKTGHPPKRTGHPPKRTGKPPGQ